MSFLVNGGGIECSALSPGATSVRLKAGEVEKRLPVTVKSSNLVAYGPAAANGLTATVTDTGRLHVKGQATVAHRGLEWELPVADEIRGRTVTFTNTANASGLYAYIHLAGAGNSDLGNIVTGQTVTVPDGVRSVKLRVAVNSTDPVDAEMRMQFNLGPSALPWMMPDDTSLNGGGV